MQIFLSQTITTHHCGDLANIFRPDNYKAFLGLEGAEAQKEPAGSYQDAEEQTELNRSEISLESRDQQESAGRRGPRRVRGPEPPPAPPARSPPGARPPPSALGPGPRRGRSAAGSARSRQEACVAAEQAGTGPAPAPPSPARRAAGLLCEARAFPRLLSAGFGRSRSGSFNCWEGNRLWAFSVLSWRTWCTSHTPQSQRSFFCPQITTYFLKESTIESMWETFYLVIKTSWCKHLNKSTFLQWKLPVSTLVISAAIHQLSWFEHIFKH